MSKSKGEKHFRLRNLPIAPFVQLQACGRWHCLHLCHDHSQLLCCRLYGQNRSMRNALDFGSQQYLHCRDVERMIVCLSPDEKTCSHRSGGKICVNCDDGKKIDGDEICHFGPCCDCGLMSLLCNVCVFCLMVKANGIGLGNGNGEKPWKMLKMFVTELLGQGVFKISQ